MIPIVVPPARPVAIIVLAAASADESSSESTGRGIASGPNQRVLIVEDEGLVAMNMEVALAEAGYTVVGIVDTEIDAIAWSERLRPDIVIMDITLSDGDGLSAAKVIRNRTTAQVIFVSGNSDPGTLAAALELKPAGFIRKPFLTGQFAKLVADAAKTRN